MLSSKKGTSMSRSRREGRWSSSQRRERSYGAFSPISSIVSSESTIVTAKPPQLSRDVFESGRSSSLPHACASYAEKASEKASRTSMARARQ